MITYNKEECFSQYQTVILLDLPSEDDLNNCRKAMYWYPSTGIQDVEFEPGATKASYIENGFKEVKVGVSPERTQMIGSSFQDQR